MEKQLQEAEDAIRTAGEGVQAVAIRLSANRETAADLEKMLRQRRASHEEYTLVNGLSRTANGELAGKEKLAFEQYVQASYFNRILQEANKRLAPMSGGRFQLLRREVAQSLAAQSGLDLDVLDHYTGKVRDVRTLSGGESFKASLSLALGLSDVVQSFAGGLQVDALFVDEGFGALDADSLEQAIRTLAQLTAGNRLVGIISHVAELGERIDKQLLVKKTNRGSEVELRVP
jgi:exonuclease SbcC